MTKESSGNGELTLVLGVDGSGKTTFLNGLSRRTGITAYEPTNYPEVGLYNSIHKDDPIDEELIKNREKLFLRLNDRLDAEIKFGLRLGVDAAMTGGSLATLVSHGLMRAVIGAREARSVDVAVDNWLEGGALMPDQMVLVYAPDEVIRKRNEERRHGGSSTTERLWGFNSPFFLSRYQEALHELTDRLARDGVAKCIRLDSSKLMPDEMLDAYEVELHLDQSIN